MSTMISIPVSEAAAHGIDLDTIDPLYGTFLHCAAVNGDTELARELLEHGANPNIRCRPGDHTPIYYAEKFHRRYIKEMLLKYGANPDDLPRIPGRR